MTLKTTSTALLLATSLLCITACSGNTNATPNVSSLPNSPMSSSAVPQDHQGCQNDGDLHVTPCRITFDSGNPGPEDVTVTRDGDRRGDGDRHGIRERDDCASRNIATIAKDSQNIYTVTAGTAMGSCTATFNDNGNRNDDHGRRGRGNGSQLRIVNNL